MSQTTDRIERKVLLKAPRARVWRALSNAEEFGNWFGVKLQGKTFTPGQRTQGQITYPGYEHIVFSIDGGSVAPLTLRVTHVYRREDGEWKIVHRHADRPPTDPLRSAEASTE